MKKIVLVTGATGFIGTALCRRLDSEGYRVRGTYRNTEDLNLLPGRMEWARIDSIGPTTDWSRALSDVWAVFHLAARAHVMQEKENDPLKAYRTVNTSGTAHLASCMVRNNVRRMVFLSSIGVHGDRTTAAPFKEDDVPAPKQPYAVSKWEAEVALKKIAADTGLETVIIRPPLVYGPGVKGNFKRLMRYVDRKMPLPIAGIRNARSFISLDNLVDALVLAIGRREAAGQTFLVSDGIDISTVDLIRMIAGFMNRQVRLFKMPVFFMNALLLPLPRARRMADQVTSSLQIDDSKFVEMMQWTPPQKQAEGIQAMVCDYLRKHS